MKDKITRNIDKNKHNQNIHKYFIDSGYPIILTVMLYEKCSLPTNDLWVLVMKLRYPENYFKALLVWVTRHIEDISMLPVSEHVEWLSNKIYIDLEWIYDNYDYSMVKEI